MYHTYMYSYISMHIWHLKVLAVLIMIINVHGMLFSVKVIDLATVRTHPLIIVN